MTAGLALVALYGVLVLAMALGARTLERPIPARYLLVFALTPVALFPAAFFANRTVLPLDHAAFIPPWSGPRTPRPYNENLNDVALQFVPWTKAVRMAWKGGELPLRDRWNGCGTPLAANGQSGAFSPFTLAGFALPLAGAFTLLVAAKVMLAAAGMWLWTRELGASAPAALLAAFGFALSLSMTPWLLFPHTAVLCLWPWTLFLIELSRRAARFKASVALVLCFAAMALAGHPESLVLGCLFMALWLLGRWAAGSLPGAPRILARTALCGLTAAGLTAWLLLPEILAILASNRFAGLAELPWGRYLSWTPHGPGWPPGLWLPLFPFTFGEAIASPMLPGAAAGFFELALAYIGITGWAAALLVLRPGARRRPEAWVLLALVVAGVATAVAQWPALELVSKLPLVRAVLPLRFLSWAALAAPALAALELGRYEKDAAAGRRPWMALVVTAAVLSGLAAAAFASHRALHEAAGGLAFQRRQLVVAVVLLVLAAGAALLLRRRVATLAIVLAALCAIELASHARHLYRLHAPGGLFPETPLVAFLRRQEGTFRVAGQGGALFPSTNVFAGMEDVRTHDPVERRDYVDFLNATCGYEPNEYFRAIRNVNAPALDFLNVRYLVTPPGGESPGPKWTGVYSGIDGLVFESRSSLPRVFAPEQVRFGAAPSEFGSTVDWKRVAFVDDPTRQGIVGNSPAKVSEYRETVNRASFRVKAPEGAPVLVVASLTQDGGWSARDESGARLRVFRANGPFLAIEIPGGQHTVQLRYSPPGFRLGVAVAAATLLVGLAGLIARRRVTALKTGT